MEDEGVEPVRGELLPEREPDWPRVYAVVQAVVQQRVPAAAVGDLAQDILLVIVTHQDQLVGAQYARAWIRGITANVCREWHRRLRAAPSVEQLSDRTYDLPDAHCVDDEQLLDPGAARSHLRRLSRGLPQQQQRIVHASGDGVTNVSDLARELGLDRRTVQRSLDRACVRLTDLAHRHRPGSKKIPPP